MKLHELSQLPFKERFKLVYDLIEGNSELSLDVKIIYDIFENTIAWFKKETNASDPNLIFKLQDKKAELPSIFETIYKIQEKSIIENLPTIERQRIFDQSKESWCLEYPHFKKISELMEVFETNDLLIEYLRKSPPESIQNKATIIYKKCLSYKVNLTNRQRKSLVYHTKTGPYSIDKEIVKNYVDEYKAWNRKIYESWHNIHYLKDDFFNNAGYKSDWKFYIESPKVLAEKASYVEKDINGIISLLNLGDIILEKHNKIISDEYNFNSAEMSLYERELEISRIADLDNENDELYCYIYTLECELFVFYIGIASDPKLRFEQHIRGAFSNESHLFKSKFIQKYHKEVKQKIVFEGIRRECKMFEKKYISKHKPLGNMTSGGEG